MLYDLIRLHDRFILLDVHGRLLTEHPCSAQVGWWVMNKIIHLPSLTNKSPNSARTFSLHFRVSARFSSDSRVSESPLFLGAPWLPSPTDGHYGPVWTIYPGPSQENSPWFLTTSDLSVTHHFLGLLYKDRVLLLINYVPHLNISY